MRNHTEEMNTMRDDDPQVEHARLMQAYNPMPPRRQSLPDLLLSIKSLLEDGDYRSTAIRQLGEAMAEADRICGENARLRRNLKAPGTLRDLK